jgi:hypothetical protein
MNILNHRLEEVIAVNVLSHSFNCINLCEFCVYHFMAICPASTLFIFISSVVVQYTGSNYNFVFISWMCKTKGIS